jgi:hypothetical protein
MRGNRILTVLIVVVSLVLVGCAGGSTGSSTTPPSPTAQLNGNWAGPVTGTNFVGATSFVFNVATLNGHFVANMGVYPPNASCFAGVSARNYQSRYLVRTSAYQEQIKAAAVVSL